MRRILLAALIPLLAPAAPRADYLIMVVNNNADAFVDTVSAVEIPISITKQGSGITPGNAALLAGLELRVNTNIGQTQLTIDSVTVASTFESWVVVVDTVNANRWDISMASPTSVDVSSDTVQVFHAYLSSGNSISVEYLESAQLVSEQGAFDTNLNNMRVNFGRENVFVSCNKGDPSRNGTTNAADAIWTLQVEADLRQGVEVDSCAADMNENGGIDVGDAILILQKSLGIIPKTTVVAGLITEVYLDPGTSKQRAILAFREGAGTRAVLTHDPSELTFVEVSQPPQGFTYIVNDREPGRLLIVVAGAASGDAELELEFSGAGTLFLQEVEAYDDTGQENVGVILSRSVEIGSQTSAPPAGSTRAYLLPARPNPFNPVTDLRFVMPAAGLADVRIYDLAGRQVSDLSLHASSGHNTISWDGRTSDGTRLPSGIYVVKLRAHGMEDRQKITLVK